MHKNDSCDMRFACRSTPPALTSAGAAQCSHLVAWQLIKCQLLLRNPCRFLGAQLFEKRHCGSCASLQPERLLLEIATTVCRRRYGCHAKWIPRSRCTRPANGSGLLSMH